MAQIHVSKDPSYQPSITFAYDLLLTTNLKPQRPDLGTRNVFRNLLEVL